MAVLTKIFSVRTHNVLQEKQTVTARIAKFLIKTIDFLLDLVIIFVVFVLTAFGIYSIWDTNQIYTSVDSKQYETYKPAVSEENSESLAELQAINSDVLGWITIYGTGVDYPLVQGTDNKKYMNESPTGSFALGGSIFLDYRNKSDFSDFNNIIYGHHMEKSQMFGDIDNFDDESYFRSHRYGNLYYGGKNHGLEFFAMVDADAYDFDLYTAEVEYKEGYLSYVKSVSRFWRDESLPMASSHIVMLSTCSDETTNGRYVLFGTISDETFEDTFAVKPGVITRTLTGTDKSGFSIPAKLILVVFVLIVLILVLISKTIYARKVRREKQKERERKRKERRRREQERQSSWRDFSTSCERTT